MTNASPKDQDRRLKANGSVIRNRRIELCWSQEQLADKCKLGLRTVQRAEAGAYVDMETLAELSAALNLPRSQLLDQPNVVNEASRNIVVLRPAGSAREVVELLLQCDVVDLDCEIDPTGKLVEPITAIAEVLENLVASRTEAGVANQRRKLSLSSRVKVTARIAQLMADLEKQGVSIFCGEYVSTTSRLMWDDEVGHYDQYDTVGLAVVSSTARARVSRTVWDKKEDKSE